MLTSDTFLMALFLGINLAAFLVMGWDKYRSRRSGMERIAEGLLFFMAIAFGSLGVFAGMFVFRHKTRTWYFLLGIPLAFAENLAALGWLLGVTH